MLIHELTRTEFLHRNRVAVDGHAGLDGLMMCCTNSNLTDSLLLLHDLEKLFTHTRLTIEYIMMMIAIGIHGRVNRPSRRTVL